MIVNGDTLLSLKPLKPMERSKKIYTAPNGMKLSYGLTECGYDIRLAQDVWLFLGRRFVLGSSLEHFTVPPNLMGRLLNKSTLARMGVDVSRSTNLEPGWEGFLTLEITYSKVLPMKLYAGMPVAQVIFEEITEPRQYVGKYNQQPNRPVKAIL